MEAYNDGMNDEEFETQYDKEESDEQDEKRIEREEESFEFIQDENYGRIY